MHINRQPRAFRTRPYHFTSHPNDNLSEQVLDAILVDDSTRLGDILAATDDINGQFTLSKFKLPPILCQSPPYPALAAFFRARACFQLFVMLSFDDKRMDSLDRSLDHFSAAGGDLEIIRELERLGHTFSRPDAEGNTPLQYACQMGKLDVVHWLWTKGIPLQNRSRTSETALSTACLMGHLDIVEFLVEKAGIPVVSDDARTSYWMRNLDTAALHAACRGGHAAIAAFLIDHGAPINELDGASETPLSIAASAGSLGCVRVLVAQPSLPRVVLNRKHSPVVDAAAFGHLDVVRCLIDAGFSPTLPNSQEMTPLECAIRNGHPRVTAFLVERGALTPDAIGPAIRAACAMSELDTVQLLVERGEVDVGRHPDANSWMQQAVELESKEIIEYFLDRGCSLKKCSIASAIKRRSEEFTQWLLARGVSVSGEQIGEPPIIAAIQAGDFGQIQALLGRGAELSGELLIRYPKCIDCAIKKHDCSLLRFLMGYKPDFSSNPVSAAAHLGTAVRDYFHRRRMAAERHQTVYWEMIKILLEAGIGVQGRQVNDVYFGFRSPPLSDPIGLAIANNCVPILELFAEHGLDFSKVEYRLSDLKYNEEGAKEMLLFLEGKGAVRRESDDAGLGIAIQCGIDEEMLDFLVARVKQRPCGGSERWGFQGALDACAKCENEAFAIRLLEQGFKCPTSWFFTNWVKQSNDQRLKELCKLQ